MTTVRDEAAEQLRASVLKLRAPQAAKRAPAPVSSVFGRAAAACPDAVRSSPTREPLDARFRNVETTALMSGTKMALVVLPDPGPVPARLLNGLELLVASGASVLILGPDLPRSVTPGAPVVLPLRIDDALTDEWALLACGPAKRAAFLARRRPDGSWTWLLTRDPVAVHRAGMATLERAPFLRLRVPPLENRSGPVRLPVRGSPTEPSPEVSCGSRSWSTPPQEAAVGCGPCQACGSP